MLDAQELARRVTGGHAELSKIVAEVVSASHGIFRHVKDNDGLGLAETKNTSGETQLELDVLADGAFRNRLTQIGTVGYVVSEEQPGLTGQAGRPYSVVLDPLDGSKSARVGIPCGAIFAVFENVRSVGDFTGRNIVASGFFVYGIRHELFAAGAGGVFRFREQDQEGVWVGAPLGKTLPRADMLAINASNFAHWPQWLRAYYSHQFDPTVPGRKPWNMRWYASLVSEVKRLILQGGVFAYPGDARPGYANGHLRLVYEALPMAYLIDALGGAATDGSEPILCRSVQELHQKTPLFLGERQQIEKLLEFQKREVS